jgi:fatty acid desaturase
VCGDCCTLTEGGAKVWAICLDCDRRDGRSLTSAWRGLLAWLGGLLLALAAVVALVGWLAGR